MTKETKMIWSEQVDAACDKYFLQGIKDEQLFQDVIYPSLVYTAKWQIRDCVWMAYIKDSQEDIEQELISYVVNLMPSYDISKGATWFSFVRKYMHYRLSHMSRLAQCKCRDVRLTFYLEDSGVAEEDFEAPVTGSQDNSRLEDTEFIELTIKWWRENLHDYFRPTSKRFYEAGKVIDAMESVVNGDMLKFENGPGRHNMLPIDMFSSFSENKTAVGTIKKIRNVNKWLYKTYELTGKLP